MDAHCKHAHQGALPRRALFPHSVEGIRQMRAYMEAFGLSKEKVKTVSCDNPAKILGLPPAA